ncbi:MAG: hypothetical protein ACOH1O_05655 [Flavobacterium sp.]
MKEGIIKNTYELLLKEFQTITTIFYILTVGIGMLFNYKKFAEFGINIFDYADVFDFLIAPFSDYRIVVFALLSMVVPYFLYILDDYYKKNHAESYKKMNTGFGEKRWYQNLMKFSYIFLIIFYVYVSAKIYGKVVKVQIVKQSPIEIRFSDNEIKKGIMIGKTKEVIFLLIGDKVEAIPITSFVKEIQVMKDFTFKQRNLSF